MIIPSDPHWDATFAECYGNTQQQRLVEYVAVLVAMICDKRWSDSKTLTPGEDVNALRKMYTTLTAIKDLPTLSGMEQVNAMLSRYRLSKYLNELMNTTGVNGFSGVPNEVQHCLEHSKIFVVM